MVQFLLPPLRWPASQGSATTCPPVKGLSPPNRQVRLFTLGLTVRASWPRPDRYSDILLLVSSQCLPLRQTPASQTGSGWRSWSCWWPPTSRCPLLKQTPASQTGSGGTLCFCQVLGRTLRHADRGDDREGINKAKAQTEVIYLHNLGMRTADYNMAANMMSAVPHHEAYPVRR